MLYLIDYKLFLKRIHKRNSPLKTKYKESIFGEWRKIYIDVVEPNRL